MGLIIFALLIVLIILVILLEGVLLLWISKSFKIEGATYKRSLFIFLIAGIVGILIGLIFSSFNLGILSAAITAPASFLVFHFLLKKYYQVRWGKSLGVYLTFGVVGTIAALIITVPVRAYVTVPFLMSGDSMRPTYASGSYLLINRFDRNFSRGDVVAFYIPNDSTNALSIKRIIGLPSEKVEIRNFNVFINGQPLDESVYKGSATKNVVAGDTSLTLGLDQYFVLGDNRDGSYDSRSFGPISKSDIVGKAWYQVY